MLTTLRLSHFRCYSSLKWDIPAEGAVLLGRNAQGKTSLIEALFFALTLHSPRSARPERMAQMGTDTFGISLTDAHNQRTVRWENHRLILRIDGIDIRDYNSYLNAAPPIIWLGNGDITLVRGAAEDRRRFLDILGTQWHPLYRETLLSYRKTLKSRNALLRNPRRNMSVLNNYADILAKYGEIIIRLRSMLLERLVPHVASYHCQLSGGREQIGLRYSPNTTEPLAIAIKQALTDDEKCGYTTVGPHRDDFSLTIGGHSAAAYASEGQQRTLATALLMAQSSLLHEETGQAPILLIDDIFGELDPTRRKAMLSLLPAESQNIITTTHLDWLKNTPCPLPLLRVENGQVTPL